MDDLSLRLPIRIKPSECGKGFMITDAFNIKHFFHRDDLSPDTPLDYEGYSKPVAKPDLDNVDPTLN